jgi:hypothetical protein
LELTEQNYQNPPENHKGGEKNPATDFAHKEARQEFLGVVRAKKRLQ